MKKFKILLVIFLLPITFILHYLTSDKYGISAYIEKQKALDAIKSDNEKVINNIINSLSILIDK